MTRLPTSPLLTRLLVITFVEAFGTMLLERGVYFYTHERLGFSDAANLWLALAFGVVYVGGALGSHAAAARLGERRLLMASTAAMLVCHLLLFAAPTAAVVAVVFPLLAVFSGLHWPVVESYIGAGSTPTAQLRIVGRFNLAWASGVPLGLVAAGWAVESASPGVLFLIAGMCNVAALGLIPRLPARPAHLPHDHPERASGDGLARTRRLLASSRWSMLSSFALLFVLAPLIPTVFSRLGLGPGAAGTAAALLDVVRLAAFVVLLWATRWHGRAWPLAWSAALLPVSFAMVIFGPSLAVVLAGEVVFGAASGVVYYAALYYAMVVRNAAVDAGGVHEGLIGVGFTAGPIAGLLGVWLSGRLGSDVAGMLLGVGPLAVGCALAGLLALRTRQALTAG